MIITKSLHKIFTHQYACVIGKFVGLVGDKLPILQAQNKEKAQRSSSIPPT
jgi:hypothetical protein